MAKEKNYTEMTKEQAAAEVMSQDEEKALNEFKSSISDMSAKELTKLQDTLAEESVKVGEEIALKKYTLNFGKEKLVANVMKYFEKHAKWKHNEVPMLASCYLSLKEMKEKGLDENGCGEMGPNDLNTLYRTFIQAEGVGYFEARKHLTLITEIGQTVTDAMQEFGSDNDNLRNIHTKLAHIDSEIAIRKGAEKQGVTVDKGAAEVVTEEIDKSAE